MRHIKSNFESAYQTVGTEMIQTILNLSLISYKALCQNQMNSWFASWVYTD